MEDSRFKMEYYSSHISKLIEQLSRLPGIGAKSAQRLAFHIINMPQDQVEQLADAMTSARSNVRYCKECFTLTDQELCPICANPKRNHKQIMVVENTRDLAAYEKTGKYEGVYHVLHGAISPMLGIGPGDIRLKELMLRLQKDVDEVIIATGCLRLRSRFVLSSVSPVYPLPQLYLFLYFLAISCICSHFCSISHTSFSCVLVRSRLCVG